jgi:hypothetical protein
MQKYSGWQCPLALQLTYTKICSIDGILAMHCYVPFFFVRQNDSSMSSLLIIAPALFPAAIAAETALNIVELSPDA